jgi:hypothetical protein
MLVWINGPFGGGKTAAGFELHRRLPGSVVCDPEFVGYGLHRMRPAGQRGDFQDLPACEPTDSTYATSPCWPSARPCCADCASAGWAGSSAMTSPSAGSMTA